MDQSCVTFALYSTLAGEPLNDIVRVQFQDILDAMTSTSVSLSTTAVHAIHTLLWKKSDTKDPVNSSQWIRILQHPIFDNAGEGNKARIARYGDQE